MIDLNLLLSIVCAGTMGGLSWYYLDREMKKKVRREFEVFKNSDLRMEARIIDRVKATYEDVLKDHNDAIANLQIQLDRLQFTKQADKAPKSDKQSKEKEVK